jgi:hypothetical protein
VRVEARRRDHQQVAALQQLALGPAEQPRHQAAAEEHPLHVEHLVDQRRGRAAEQLAGQRQGAHVDVASVEEVGLAQHPAMAQHPRQRQQQRQQAPEIGAVLRDAEMDVVPERLEAAGELVAPEVEADDAQAEAGEGADALHHRALRPVVTEEGDAALQRRLRGRSGG